MKTKLLLLLITFCALSANAFKVGKINYTIIDDANKWVEIAPLPNDAAYSNIKSSDLSATVTYDNVTYTVVGIGEYAFCNATFSGTLRLPEGLLYIGASAFSFAGGESSGVRVSSTVKYIDELAFTENQFHNISVDTNNPYFASLYCEDNPGGEIALLTNKAKTAIISVTGARAKSYNIDGSTTYVTSLNIPEQITRIENYAFYHNQHLTNVRFHSGITYIGNNAFCKSVINSANLPKADCEYGDGIFSDCHQLSSASLPQGLKELPTRIFFCCDALKSITLPEGMVILGKQSLSSTSISSINLPESLELLDTCALQWTLISSINLKNVKQINNQCFGCCENLTTITGGEKLEEISGAVFTRCTSLTDTQLPSNIKRILDGPYMRCTALTNAFIPASVTYIDRNPFYYCSALKEVKVDSENPYYAELDSCLYELKNGKPNRLITVPKGRENMVLVVRDGTTVISEQAIREVPLTAIYAPADLKEICDGSGFSNQIMTVQMLATVPPAGGKTFASETYTNGTLYVPKGSVEAYKAAEGWKKFQNIVGIDVTEPGIKGDINGDGMVDVIDLNTLINMILGSAEVTDAADLNGDTIVDVADMNALINLILNN